MNYKILFLDIDGTILKPDHTYSPSTKEAIVQVQQQGILVFLCTGRPLHEVNDLAHDLGIDAYIGYNGAYAAYQDKPLVNEPMKQHTLESFLLLASKHHHELVCYTSEKNYFTTLFNSITKDFAEVFQLKQNERLSDHVLDQILGASIMNVSPDQIKLYEAMEEGIHLSKVNVEGVENCYDIIRKQVNKGEAVKGVLKHLQIKKEQAIAFGDGMNDKEMLQAVGEGFIMENGDPNLLPFAKHQTTSVQNSGIFNGLKQLGLVK
ncbi:Cof-type HAD-IIB family hydrolase [Virgibacillus salarius]|uniref:HAD family hydrolase n=1 Tax=Virgibacillus salarius TaxID=447199 RepID=UPI0004157DD0|nr:HAD family hydrolase [Priestia megaterium]